MKAIIDGRLVMPDTVLDGYALLYDGNTILDVVTQDSVNTDACESVVRADGALIMPGFINEHIHGCAGVDTMDEDAGALLKMQQVLPATGVTSFLPTTMTYDRRRIEEALQRIRQAKANPGTRILGAHMEGPFISQAYKGAQKAENISAADFSWLEPYADVVKIITLAPETLKDRSFLEQCAAHHIIVSVGHSAASYEEVRSIMQIAHSITSRISSTR